MDLDTLRLRISARCSLGPLKVPAFSILSALQEHPADIQIEALFLCATLMAQSAGLPPHDMVGRALRQISDGDAVRSPHLEAIRDFAAGELK